MSFFKHQTMFKMIKFAKKFHTPNIRLRALHSRTNEKDLTSSQVEAKTTEKLIFARLRVLTQHGVECSFVIALFLLGRLIEKRLTQFLSRRSPAVPNATRLFQRVRHFFVRRFRQQEHQHSVQKRKDSKYGHGHAHAGHTGEYAYKWRQYRP